jgi:pyruvate dehydrogenase (quinone)
MPRMTVADQFIEVLRQVGVDRTYGVVGDSLNPIVDAVRRTDGIEWVHVRNEEAGAFAAGAQAGRLAPGSARQARQGPASGRPPNR